VIPVQAVANNHDAVEREAGFGTVPGDELVDGVLVHTARGWRAQAVEHGPSYNDPDPAVEATGDGNSD